jgi:hypothetical protein
LNRDSKVLFTGVDVGGVLAKLLGMLTEHRGIGFLSMQAADSQAVYRYNIGVKERRLITNVFNERGTIGVGEAQAGEDFAIPGPFDVLNRASIYDSFCNLAVMCGHHRQFQEYCEAAIGADRVNRIREYFGIQSD